MRSPRRTCCSSAWRDSPISCGRGTFPAIGTERHVEKIGCVIGRLADDHVPPAQLLPEIERQIPELERWVRDHNLIELDPTKPLIVRETPPHKRGIAGASIDSPGPYDAGAPTYYNVTPLDDLPAARAESWLREYNRWMLPVLNIHEAIPGPLRAARLCEPLAESDQIDLRQRRDDRRLGRLLRAHDARVGLRRAQTPRLGSSIRSGTCAASATRSSTTACMCSA